MSKAKAEVANTASSIYNNLTATNEGCFMFASKDRAMIIRALGAVPVLQSAHIQCLRALQIQGRWVLAIANKVAVVIYDFDRDQPLLTIPNNNEECRGLAVVSFDGAECLLVGYGDGNVGMFNFRATDFVIFGNPSRSPVHSCAVTCIASGHPETGVAALSCDINGDVRFWNSSLQVFASQSSPGDCATSCELFNGYGVVAFGSGTIRFYAAQNAELQIVLSAHSRWINAMSYNSVRNLLATASEDGLVSVWNMPSSSDGRVTIASQFVEKNRLIVGVVFSNNGKMVSTAAYDCDDVLHYPLP